MYNQVNVEGIITTSPQIKESRNGIPYTFFTIENEQLNSTYSNLIDCMAWRNNAEHITKNVKEGDKINIVGKLMTMPPTENKSKSTYIKVEKAYIESKNETLSSDIEEIIEEIDIDDDIPF